MEKEILKERNGGAEYAAAAPSVKTPEDFFFVFVCRGSRAAYREIEAFIKKRTTAQLIFQRYSRNYLSVSEIKAERVFPTASVDWPDTLPGCFGEYGKPIQPNSCGACRMRNLCRNQEGGADE